MNQNKFKGNVNTTKDQGQKVEGTLKDKFGKTLHNVGDAIEAVGEKLEKRGMTKTGEAVHKLGDKIEHLGD